MSEKTLEIKYYKNKKGEKWVVYSKNVEATKITSDWFFGFHTINDVPNNNKKYSWQKKA